MDKPLHVQVAEALGWFGFQPSLNGMWPEEWRGREPVPIVGEAPKEVPRYDRDWSATGPLIERMNITLFRDFGMYDQTKPWTNNWRAMFRAADDLQFGAAMEAEAPTPLIAVCNLIVALHAAGKLKAQESIPA